MRLGPTVLATIALIPIAAASADDRELSSKEVANLIKNLGSNKYSEREAATHRLSRLDDIPPALSAAAKSRNAEIARRAKIAIAQIVKRNEQRFIEKELAAVNRMGFDRFVDRMVLTPGFATEQRWKALVRAAEQVMDRSNKLGYAGTPLPQIKWSELPLIEDLPPRYTQSSRVLVDGHSQRMSGFRTCMALSSGSFERMAMVQDSILIVNGDLPRMSRVTNSLIICTGDVGPISMLRNSVILTTGSFEGASTAQNSLVQASKMDRRPSGDSNVFVNLGKAPEGDANRYVETGQSVLSVFKLFSPQMLGMSVTLANGEARVQSVSDQSPLALAGLKQGDKVLAIGTEKWISDEVFRTMLRRKSAQPSTTFTIRRDGRERTLTVKFEE